MENQAKTIVVQEKTNASTWIAWKTKVGSYALIEKYDYETKKDSPLISKQKELFDKIINKKQDKILNLNQKNNFNELKYNSKAKRIPKKDFSVFDNAITF